MSTMMKYIFMFGMSMVPVLEQRGAIIYGFTQNLNPFIIFVLTYVGSLIPAPIIFFFFTKIMEVIHKMPSLKWFSDFINNKINKNKDHFVKYKEIGLITFIGIPLPMTGVYTGTAVATVLKLDFKKVMFCAAIGGLISSSIVTLGCIYVPALFGF